MKLMDNQNQIDFLQITCYHYLSSVIPMIRRRGFMNVLRPKTNPLLRENLRIARQLFGGILPNRVLKSLETLSRDFRFSLGNGELQFINSSWYVTHTGLVRLARRKRCSGIHVEVVDSLCDSGASRFVLRATVYPSKSSSGFVGYGDADPSNVSFQVHGAEMRVAETRAVNRALRKAYGIGICSAEEIGSLAEAPQAPRESKKLPPQPANGVGGRTVRDRLCQVIRQHQLDPNLVKNYAD